MSETKNPGRGQGAHRVPKVKAFSSSIDVLNPTETHPKYQSETLAVRTLAQRFGLTIHHARVVSELAGIGGNV